MNTTLEWLVGTSPLEGVAQVHLAHLTYPRFTMHVVEASPDRWETERDAYLGSAEVAWFSAITGNMIVLDGANWIDDLSDEEKMAWVNAAAEAFDGSRLGHFKRWRKLPPVRFMANFMGIPLDDMNEWNDYSEFVTRFMFSGLLSRARALYRQLDMRQMAVLQAMFLAAGCPEIADEFAEHKMFERIRCVGGASADAISLAITTPR